MKLLSLDPSSACIGYAVLTGLDRADLVGGGIIWPSMAKAQWKDAPAWARTQWFGDPLIPCRRILSMMKDIDEQLEEHLPDRVVVEFPSGKAGTGSKKGASASLTTYGAAAGMILMHCAMRAGMARCKGDKVMAVTERQWTVGQTKKANRPTSVLAMYGDKYDPAKDEGSDLADAILLGRWWIEQEACCAR